MPTYEYRCDTCGTVVEAVQGFHDAPLTTCPNCEGALRKLFGNVGVVFKGSGFYRNDARAEGKKAASAAQAKKESAGSSSSDSSSPAKSGDTSATSSKPSESSSKKDTKASA